MHKLDRSSVAAPECLRRYNCRTQKWAEVTSEDREQTRASLEQMQDDRCAYCEGPLHGQGHIEHFRPKGHGHYPQLTFAWDNLFLSCNSSTHCGRHKDRSGAPPYAPSDLVKPDEDAPDDFLHFHSSGQVRPRCSEESEHGRRARETIRVLNLNSDRLRAARRRALRAYTALEPDIIATLMEFDEEYRKEFIDEEIQRTQRDPYWTVIRHYFEQVSR